MAAMWKAAWAIFPFMIFAPSADALLHSASKESEAEDATGDASRTPAYQLKVYCGAGETITNPTECVTAAAALGLTVNNVANGYDL
eukprot:5523501-Pyramimonas_sp.AAC.1